MSAERNGNSHTPLSPTPRELAATLFRRPRLVAASFGFVLLATMLFVVFSARYESHFKVLLRRGRFDPIVSSQPPSAMDFTRPDITEEELNSEVELLRDEDLLKQVVKMAGLVPANTPNLERSAETEHAVRKLVRRLDVEALKKSNLIQVSYKDTDPERAARILAALSTLYVQRHTNLQRPPGEIQFFDQQAAEYEKRLHRSEAELVHFTRARGVASAALERDIALQKLGEADAAYRQIDQDRVETERRVASLGEQLKSFPSRSVTLKRWADNPQALEKMKTHLLELQLKRTELLSRFEPSYRLVQEVEQEIAETRAELAAEALTPVRDETTDKDPNYEWARMEMEKAQVQWDGLRARQSDAAAQVVSLRQVAQQMQSDSVDLALLDAMAAGVCVLTSDIPENKEVVEGAGFTFRHGDQADLERMLDLLIHNPELRRQSAAGERERIQGQYLWPEIARSIEKAYYNVLGWMPSEIPIHTSATG